MKENCIVCAKEFDNPNMERLTCSGECKQKWIEFLRKLNSLPKEEREEYSKEFFKTFNAKNIADFIQGKTDSPIFF